LYFAIGGFAFLYGLFFGVTTIFLLVQLSIPLVLLALLVIWMLPETGRASLGLLERLFFIFIAGLLCWPDYLAIAIPPIPWITVVRLVVAPLALVFLVSLSQSSKFRNELKGILGAAPVVAKLLLAFWLVAAISVAFSETPASSLNLLIVYTLNWFMVAVIASYVLAQPGRMRTFAYLIWFIGIGVCIIGVLEARRGAVVWLGHIPSFLQIQVDSVQRSLAGSFRAGVGVHRVQSKFTTPLGFAEFLGCSVSFVFYIAVFGNNKYVRAMAALTVPLMIYNIIKTDSRLGMVGFSSAILLSVLLWGVVEWKRDRNSILGPAAIFSFPAAVVVFISASFFVGRLRALIWGTGAQLDSTDARIEQLHLGIPKILAQPWGYGVGRGGITLGYVNQAGELSIDNYYLGMALDYGIIGLLIFLLMFFLLIFKSCSIIVKSREIHEDHILLGFSVICLINFLIIKTIFSQTESHPFFFAVFGGCLALLYRLKGRQARQCDR